MSRDSLGRIESGCCRDEACNEATCMCLPAEKTCADCAHCRRCVAIFGVKPENAWCDFFPRRFLPILPTTAGGAS